MSDYLGNLLARSTNPKDVVQPRPMSLFEPLPGTAWSPSGHLPAPEAEEGEPVSRDWTLDASETMQSTGRHPRPSPLVADPSGKGGSPGFLPPRADLRAGSPEPQQLPALASHRLDRAKAEPLRIQPVPSSAHVGTAPSPSMRVQPGSVRTIESGPPQSGAVQSAPAPAATHAAWSDAPLPVTERAAQPDIEPTVKHTLIERIIRQTASPPNPAAGACSQDPPPRSLAEPESRPPAKAVTPQSGPVLPLPVVARPQARPETQPRLSSAAEQATKPEPIIHVTIGRIEVRATPASSPPRKQTPAASMMSLEDYLRQRNGGGR